MSKRKLKYNLVDSRYRRLSLITLIAVYFLILVGGIVRSTGSGMGCPDWPKCFGQWVPPTSESQLPTDYQQFYSDYRHEKNIRFAEYLKTFGFPDVATALLADESIREEATFNPYKTWTEYVNRLVGVIVGFLIMATFAFSIPYVNRRKDVFLLAFSSFVLVLIQGWLGSIVVSTNLLPWLVTIHMVLALVILLALTALYYRTGLPYNERSVTFSIARLKGMLIVGMVLMFVQIVFGTQVRESIDIVAARMGDTLRSEWISGLGINFLIHRSFSLVILFFHSYILFYLYKHRRTASTFNMLFKVLLTLMAVEILSGAMMAYFAIPFFLQPIHLLIGCLILGMQFYCYLYLRKYHTDNYSFT